MIGNQHDKITALLNAFGWERIKDPNYYTISFVHPEKPGGRINWYFTKRTFQLQLGWNGRSFVEKQATLEDIEKIIANI